MDEQLPLTLGKLARAVGGTLRAGDPAALVPGLSIDSRALSPGDLFVAIGTSGAVWPAAGFVELARFAGARTVELNLAPTLGRRRFDEGLYGPATEVVPAFVETLLA